MTLAVRLVTDASTVMSPTMAPGFRVTICIQASGWLRVRIQRLDAHLQAWDHRLGASLLPSMHAALRHTWRQPAALVVAQPFGHLAHLDKAHGREGDLSTVEGIEQVKSGDVMRRRESCVSQIYPAFDTRFTPMPLSTFICA